MVAWLDIALDEGRLSLAEYERRLEGAYAATVRGDLRLLTVDLPSPGRREIERRMPSSETGEYGGRGYPPSRTAPYVTVLVVGFIVGAFYGRFIGSMWPLVCGFVTVGVVGGLGWLFWDPYGHKGRRD